MIPDSFAAFYAFLGLVAPGLVFHMLREHRRAPLQESSIREAGRIALTSLLFTSASLLILSVAGVVWPAAFADLRSWAQLGDPYLRNHLEVAVTTVAVEVLLACALAVVVSLFLGPVGVERRPAFKQLFGAHEVSNASVWYRLFTYELPRDRSPWVEVTLDDGTVIYGYVYEYTADTATSDRELSLQGPGLRTRRAGRDLEERYFDYITLKESRIKVLKVAYEPRAEDGGQSQPTPEEETASPPQPQLTSGS